MDVVTSGSGTVDWVVAATGGEETGATGGADTGSRETGEGTGADGAGAERFQSEEAGMEVIVDGMNGWDGGGLLWERRKSWGGWGGRKGGHGEDRGR